MESTESSESRSFTQLHPRLDALEQEVREQLPNVGEVIMQPRGEAADEWALIEAIVLQARGVDIGQGRPSWASIRVSRTAMTGSFADFGATVENGVRLLRRQLVEQHAPGQLAADAQMTQAKTVAPVPPGREEEAVETGLPLASAVQTSPVRTVSPTPSSSTGTTASSPPRLSSTPAVSSGSGKHEQLRTPLPPRQPSSGRDGAVSDGAA